MSGRYAHFLSDNQYWQISLDPFQPGRHWDIREVLKVQQRLQLSHFLEDLEHLYKNVQITMQEGNAKYQMSGVNPYCRSS